MSTAPCRNHVYFCNPDLVSVCVHCGRTKDEIESAKSSNGQLFRCKNCGHDNYVLWNDGIIICTSCAMDNGTVLITGGSGYETDAGGHDNPKDKSLDKGYKRRFYFNELVSQFIRDCPKIPKKLFVLIQEAYSRREKELIGGEEARTPTTLSKETVHEICKSVCTRKQRKLNGVKKRHWVRLRKRILTKYNSKYKQKEKFNDLRKYGEKWRSIGKILTGEAPPYNRRIADCLDCAASQLPLIEYAFNIVRHKTRKPHSCKKMRCRKHMISYPFIIKRLTDMFYMDKNPEEAEHVKKWWPGVSQKKELDIMNKWWKPMVELIVSQLTTNKKIAQRWEYSVTRFFELHSRQSNKN